MENLTYFLINFMNIEKQFISVSEIFLNLQTEQLARISYSKSNN